MAGASYLETFPGDDSLHGLHFANNLFATMFRHLDDVRPINNKDGEPTVDCPVGQRAFQIAWLKLELDCFTYLR